jgi:uncharacterized protein (DUF2235 family)
MKRLITCTDGTWNRPGITDRGQLVRSNVELIYNCICNGIGKDGIEQLKIYDSGVGSSTFSKKDQILGGMAGAGIDKNIKDVYKFLMLNYTVGDEIYLFGFSRGAYTARSLAGFIRNCGILKPENIHLVDEAYELYRDRNAYTQPDSDLMKGFKNKFCFENITPIKFIGVWDTVGSLGMPFRSKRKYNLERYKFHDVKISSTIDFAYHALAIDERRSIFSPTLWELSDTVKNNPNHKQIMEQRWFAGVHCNVGGGYVDCGLSDAALKWLIDKATAVGLNFNLDALTKLEPKHELKPNAAGEQRNSNTIIYWLFRPIWRNVLKGKYTNETIDDSVKERHKLISAYAPPNIIDWLTKNK